MKKVNTLGKVYLLGDSDRLDAYKIGSTRGSVEDRIKALQTGNGGEIYEVCHFETKYPFMMETFLHRRFKNKQILNEWFLLDGDDVKGFMDTCSKVEEQIESLKENFFFRKKFEKNKKKL